MTCSRPAATAWARSTRSSSTRRQVPPSGCSSPSKTALPFVPLAGATVEEQSIRVDQDAERVQAAPRPEAGETLSVGDEKRLYEHYGLQYSQAESPSVLPEGATTEEQPRLQK